MPVPTHRPDCETILYQTSCWDCGKRVWYFACSCGSLVLFDTKGKPWLQHKDSCSIYWLKQLIQRGWSISKIRGLIDGEAQRERKQVPNEILQALAKYEGGEPIIIDVLPTDESVLITGMIQSIDTVNFYRRFGFMPSPAATAVLGDLVNEDYVEITLQEQGPSATGALRRCTFFAPKGLVDSERHQVGKTLIASLDLEGIVDDENQAIWVAQRISAVRSY